MAETFADRLPLTTLSIAEIQGFLLLKRANPSGALEDADNWGKTMVTDREKEDLSTSGVTVAREHCIIKSEELSRDAILHQGW